MLAILSLLVVVVLSLIVVRVGAVSLRMTGMSDAAARFQARSAFTGTGYTTMEAEQVVGHPLRRRIVSTLMTLGSVGLVAASGTLIMSFIGLQERPDTGRIALLVVGLVVLYVIAMSKIADRAICTVITTALGRFTKLETRDFTTLLHLRDDYRVAEIFVGPSDWMIGQTLADMRLEDKGVLVLGVEQRDGSYVGAPRGAFRVEAGQTLVVYGLPDPVQELDGRNEKSGAETSGG